VVVVTAPDDAIAGFATLKAIDADTFSIPLNGVAPEHQGRGLYGGLLRLAQRWGIERNLRRLVISTQVDNLRAQRAWCRLGFLPFRSEYTLHLWIDR
jgi:ribosomal protein S18 acetylase RimI-like enzyme